MIAFYIKVEGGRLAEVKFQSFGCVAAIAISNMVSEMVRKVMDFSIVVIM